MVDTNQRPSRGAGGTPGGIGTFFLGLIMIVAGGYLLTDQVMVTSGAWRWGGYNAFGLSLLPLLLGVGLLFVNGRSLAGWLLTWRRRRDYFCWYPRTPGDLLSPHQSVQYVAHAGPLRRWPRPGRPVSAGVVSPSPHLVE